MDSGAENTAIGTTRPAVHQHCIYRIYWRGGGGGYICTWTFIADQDHDTGLDLDSTR